MTDVNNLLEHRKCVIELIQQKYDQYLHDIQPYCDQLLAIEAELQRTMYGEQQSIPFSPDVENIIFEDRTK